MPFVVAAFVTRKPELTPTEFKNAYETTHIPLLKEIAGETYPDSLIRNYVRRAKSDPEGLKPLSFTGSEETFGYDLVSYFSFADEAKAGEFQQKYAEAQEKIGANVAEFAQLDKFRVIAFEEPVVN